MKSIYVGNLDSSTTEDELRTLFLAQGAVEKVRIVRDRDTGRSCGYAFLDMTNDGEADRAVQALDGTVLGGRTLIVVHASNPSTA